MAVSRKERDAMRALCGEVHPDDGIDPREFFRGSGARRQKNDYATLRLAAQVRQTLELILPGALGDLGLALRVEAVTPAPDATRFLVTVMAHALTSDATRREIESRLAELAPTLRSEVARSITRRKAPALAYALRVDDEASSPGGEPNADS